MQEAGHMMANCPLLRPNQIDSKERATCATLGEVESSESRKDSDNEETILCFRPLKKTSKKVMK